MDSLELYNFSEEDGGKDWSIQVKHCKRWVDSGTPWLGFSQSSGTIPPRSGETPGMVEIDHQEN